MYLKMPLTTENIDDLIGAMECEGFDYAFASWSDFKEIKDEEFHRMRKEFLAAREKFVKYLEKNGVEIE
jgi:hypothetical protein